MDIRTELVTAERAARLVATVLPVPMLPGEQVIRYGRKMLAGAWQPGLPALVIIGGRLNDGLHRCQAVAWAAEQLGDPSFGVQMTVIYVPGRAMA